MQFLRILVVGAIPALSLATAFTARASETEPYLSFNRRFRGSSASSRTQHELW